MKDKNNNKRGVPPLKAASQKSFHKERHAWSAKKLIVPAIIMTTVIMIGYIFAAAL
jgi:hypothetical protein